MKWPQRPQVIQATVGRTISGEADQVEDADARPGRSL